MAFDIELTLKGFFRSQSPSDDPSSNELHLHWKHCRRVFQRTHYGIQPPTEDEPLGPSRGSYSGFCLWPLSEFQHQIWISLAVLNFQPSVCNFLYHKIMSFAIDFAVERPWLCPSLILVAEINFVQKLYVDYTRRPLEFIQHGQLGAAALVDETLFLRTSTEGTEVDSNAFVDDTLILEGTTEGWGGAEVDSNTLLDEMFILGMVAEVERDNNAEIEKLERIKRGKWVMGGGEEVKCSVCLEDFSAGQEVMTTECKHSYHEECIVTWVKKKQTCPLCRRQI